MTARLVIAPFGSPKETRIVIADDHPVVRGGLRELFSRSTGLSVVGEAEDYASIMAALRAQPCDVLVLDVGLPGRDGIEVLRIAKRNWPRLRVLVISGLPETHYAIRALQAGADGYISKLSDFAQLTRAVKEVAGGRRFVTPDLAAQLAERVSEPAPQAPHQLLSDRELAIFRRIFEGLRPREIAAELSISAKSVSVYRSRILHKLGLRTDAELATYATRERLFER